jgi:tubulin polyglutamylase TTLL4
MSTLKATEIPPEDNDGDNDNDSDSSEKDEDEESPYRDPPENHVRLRPSCVPFLPPTIFFEYPLELGIKREDISVLEPLRYRKLGYKSFWERICVRNAFKRAGFEKSKNWSVLWSKHQNDSQLNGLECIQKVNHFPASWCVGRKDRLSRTLNLMKRIHGKEFDFHPETFILPSDKDSFLRNLKSLSDSSNSLWIVKPCASSCGRGIFVANYSQVHQLATKNKKPQLIQKYLSNPYLIDGKKFDLRIYILVTGGINISLSNFN